MKKHFHQGLKLNIYLSTKRMCFSRFSYPYSEDHLEARSYLRARCPAWCDRILLSHSFKNLVNTEVTISLSFSHNFLNKFSSD